MKPKCFVLNYYTCAGIYFAFNLTSFTFALDEPGQAKPSQAERFRANAFPLTLSFVSLFSSFHRFQIT